MQFGRRARATTAALVAAVALGGCSGDGIPEGYEQVQTGWMRVAVPEGWVEGGQVTDRWTESYQDAEGDAATVQLLLAPEWGETDALVATSSVIASAQVGGFPGFRIVDGPETDEEQNHLLRDRVDFTYEGEDGTYEGVLWGLADDEDHVVMAQLTGKDLDPDLVAAIDESLEVTG
ncbi:hypothetical protein H9623_01800 [Oerskovia sp. Sa1BUA8]|uniref:Uncharacterized protein n=1 Tax=Oerskovia douganii TaxID=2762210 RepID=A0A9D5UEC0_9CELL|nr:hypothetical protein [Oerskovia douganii]MBE7699042.1 hypothetical protein [Oerskovia douganii]